MSLIKKKNSFFHQLYINNMYLFFIRVFFHGHWRLTGQQGKREDHLLLHSTSPIYSYLQLCMWDKDHIFLIAPLAFSRLLLDEIYHLMELLFDWLIDCWLIDWLIDWWSNVCLFTWWFDSRLLPQQLNTGNRWTQTRIDYHPSITSEPTNQVC